MELTPAELQEILKVFVDSELRELQLQVGDVSLSVSKNDTGVMTPAPVPAHPRPAQSTKDVSSPAPSETQDYVGTAATVEEQPAPASAEVDRSGLHALRSPLVGVFYRRPGPDQPPYIEVGDEVKKGDPVCTISVMKMFTEIAADRAGRIVEISVENETLVEHGQVLMYIDSTDDS